MVGPELHVLVRRLTLCMSDAQVYVSMAKRAVLEALGLPPEYKELLTTDDRAARLHAVPLWRVSLKHMARLLKHYRGRFTTIVGFQPTGWSMQTGAHDLCPAVLGLDGWAAMLLRTAVMLGVKDAHGSMHMPL
jgi:hypothetical protein